MTSRQIVCLLSLFCCLGTGAAVEALDEIPGQWTRFPNQWTRFRGPNGAGLAPGEGIPSTWGEADMNWKVTLPGKGHAQPVIWGERIFMRGANDDGTKRYVFCLGVKAGTVEWIREFEAARDERHNLSSHASSTPTVDAERLYVIYATTEKGWVKALDHQGNDVWTVDLGPYKVRHVHGASPIVFRDMLIVPKEVQADSFLLALDRKTGKEIWRIPRESSHTSYSTPCVYHPASGNPQLIFNSHANGMTAVDALQGEVLWEAKVFKKRTVSSPVLGPGLAIGTVGSGGGGNYLVAIKLGGEGDVTETHQAYKITQAAPYVPTPVIRGERMFLLTRTGIASWVKVRTGDVIWRERLDAKFFGSPVCVGDRFFCISKSGDVVVLAAGDEYKLLGRTPLGDESHSTPAVADGRLYLRTLEHLYSVGGKTPPSGD